MEENKMVETSVETVVEEKIPETMTEEDSLEIAINKMFAKTFTTLPMFLRVKYLMEKVKDIPDDQLSYSRINSLLHANIAEGDFNLIPEEIKNEEDICKLYNNICNAVAGLSVWCKRVCKDCGKEFYMYLSEVDFYKGKGFAFPKRCKNCVKNRKESQQQG